MPRPWPPRRLGLHQLSRPGQAPVQFVKNDELATPLDAAFYVEAASDPKEVRWYDTDHYFNEEWLGRVMAAR